MSKYDELKYFVPEHLRDPKDWAWNVYNPIKGMWVRDAAVKFHVDLFKQAYPEVSVNPEVPVK